MSDYARIKEAIQFLRDHATCQPSLQDVADAVGVSPFHLQRTFRRWAGISPKRFLQFLTVEHAKRLLAESASVLEATWDTGLSSPGRLHDLFVNAEAVTPGEYKEAGAGLEIRWGLHETPFGRALVAVSDRGVCALEFVDGDGREALTRLRGDWPRACLVEAPDATEAAAERAFAFAGERDAPLGLHLRGTNFQLKVWQALLRVPPGDVVSYAGLSRLAGEGSPRAVGGAVGANRIAYLIPCHRVLRADGALGGYRWGEVRKAALVGWESAARRGEGASTRPAARGASR